MSLLLIAAALVSAGPLGEVGDALAISLIVILNVVVAVVQEEKAATALDALRSAAAPSATVIRDGRSEVIPAAEVVPGDVVLVAAGDRVAADLWLTQSWAVEADESMLTGEDVPAPPDLFEHYPQALEGFAHPVPAAELRDTSAASSPSAR